MAVPCPWNLMSFRNTYIISNQGKISMCLQRNVCFCLYLVCMIENTCTFPSKIPMVYVQHNKQYKAIKRMYYHIYFTCTIRYVMCFTLTRVRVVRSNYLACGGTVRCQLYVLHVTFNSQHVTAMPVTSYYRDVPFV